MQAVLKRILKRVTGKQKTIVFFACISFPMCVLRYAAYKDAFAAQLGLTSKIRSSPAMGTLPNPKDS
jgi:hypothetical protein